MAADKYVRPVLIYQCTGPRVVSSRISAYMCHEDLHPFTFEEAVQGMDETEVVVVAIASHSDKGPEGGDLFRKGHSSAEVSGMPDLVHRLKEIAELPAEYAVGV